jgi:hypothetical protein
MTNREEISAFVEGFTGVVTGTDTTSAAAQAGRELRVLTAIARKGEGDSLMENTVVVGCMHCYREILVVRGDMAARCPLCGYTFAAPPMEEPGHECGDVRTGTDG